MTTALTYRLDWVPTDEVIENVRNHQQVGSVDHYRDGQEYVVEVSYHHAVNPWIHALLNRIGIGEACDDIDSSPDWVRPSKLTE